MVVLLVSARVGRRQDIRDNFSKLFLRGEFFWINLVKKIGDLWYFHTISELYFAILFLSEFSYETYRIYHGW